MTPIPMNPPNPNAAVRPDGGLSSPNAAARRSTRHTRHGKIARLPHAVRERVNRLLNDGVSYPAIIGHLAEVGFPGITTHGISRWKHGGYQEWLEAQEKFDLEKYQA